MHPVDKEYGIFNALSEQYTYNFQRIYALW